MQRPSGIWMIDEIGDHAADWPRMNDWGLRVAGYLTPPVSGRVRFFLETPNAARLLLDDRAVVEVEAGEEGGEGSIEARAGRPMALVLEYRQKLPPSRLRVAWQLPGCEAEPIPAAALSDDPEDREKLLARGLPVAA